VARFARPVEDGPVPIAVELELLEPEPTDEPLVPIVDDEPPFLRVLEPLVPVVFDELPLP
jgi:hypothetical protein